jgi:transposase InsO family protein
MPWQEVSAMSLKQEFVLLAIREGANVRELCRRFEISARTGYKWLDRYEGIGAEGLVERSRRPHRSPAQTPQPVEAAVLTVREAHPVWGGRKIRARLLHLGHQQVPSPSTITAILHRHGLIDPAESAKRPHWQRFEHPEPNALWQMDFKGHFAMDRGRCHPLTVLDDHSRFAVGLESCGDERGDTVRARLITIFRHYGLPERMVMDNGAPWGADAAHPHTPLTVWLMHLGIRVSHGRPYHPQTQGKDERFHRTLKAELLQGNTFTDLLACQRAFDHWRSVYNLERPHQALGLVTPVTRYASSPRAFPETLPPVEYGDDDLVRNVMAEGWVNFKGRKFRISMAFRGYPVAFRPTATEGVWDIWFMIHRVAQVDLRGPEPVIDRIVEGVNHVSEQV